jgi:hypothetical protein
MTTVGVAKNTKTTDQEIRDYLLELLKATSTKLVEEFNVDNGVSRADIVGISDAELHGYEIKSDVDSLARLTGQVHSYSKVFSRMTLVVGASHIRQAMYMVPEWWGVTLAKKNHDGQVVFSQIRKARLNPQLDISSLLKLLLKEEINVVIKSSNVASRSTTTKAGLSHRLLTQLNDDEIQKAVSASLFRRYCS